MANARSEKLINDPRSVWHRMRALGNTLEERYPSTGLEAALTARFGEVWLSEAITEGAFTSKRLNLCAPASAVFSKFVKLPQVDANKVTQIIQYEAQQNVPFPLDEVVWDYQILGATPAGEVEVLLVAIKNDVVDGFFRSCEAARCSLQLIDASPAGLCNAFRFNYSDVEECAMLLDIGAKTSNVLIFEKGKVFSRSINIGANSITTDFSNEAKMSYADAEKLKIESGFVSLGAPTRNRMIPIRP